MRRFLAHKDATGSAIGAVICCRRCASTSRRACESGKSLTRCGQKVKDASARSWDTNGYLAPVPQLLCCPSRDCPGHWRRTLAGSEPSSLLTRRWREQHSNRRFRGGRTRRFVCRCPRPASVAEPTISPDSLLEGDGFEPSVPQQIRSPVRDSSPVSLASQNRNVRSMTDRKPCMAIARFIASKCARLPTLIEPRVMPRPVSNKGFRSRRLAPKNEPRQGGRGAPVGALASCRG
jgi:hypothetical protein